SLRDTHTWQRGTLRWQVVTAVPLRVPASSRLAHRRVEVRLRTGCRPVPEHVGEFTPRGPVLAGLHPRLSREGIYATADLRDDGQAVHRRGSARVLGRPFGRHVIDGPEHLGRDAVCHGATLSREVA